jgi:hypothetical protein
MKKIQCYIILFFLTLSFTSFAQDTIRTKKDTIAGKVVEIGLEEIKYKDFQNLDGPIIVIEKSKVIEITYENGTKFFNRPDPYEVNKEIEVRGKTHAIKFELFSPVTGDIAFGYESMISVGKNLEVKLGIIGPGTKNGYNSSGVFVKGGIKFLTSPQYVQNGLKYVHPLKGRYIKPELILNTYSEDREYYNNNYNYYSTSIEKVHFTNIAFNIIFGTQHILGNAMTVDYYVGIGYGFRISDKTSSNSNETIYREYAFSHSYLGTSAMMISGGFTIGGIF